MADVKFSKAELEALDAMIKTFQEQGYPGDKRVELRRVIARPSTTVFLRVLRITRTRARTPRPLAQDAKTLARIDALTGTLKTKMSLDELLALRRQATGND